MVDVMRAMLDELMGKERDVPLDQRTNKAIRFHDSSVCKHQLAGLCPNRLFINTRSDLGPCGYEIHDDHLEWPKVKEEYDKLDEREKERYGYERDLLKYLEQLIRDMDKKIRVNRERADKESAPKDLRPEDRARLDEMQARIKEQLDLSGRLGEEGDVDGSMMATQQAEAMKQQRDALLRSLTAPERTMNVCEVCGVFMNSTDNDQRKADHYNGKQYLGWLAIRQKLAELTEKFARSGGSAREREPEPDRLRERDPRDRERHSSRDRERERERERPSGRSERDYERERDRYGGSRDREREREHRDSHKDRDSRRDHERYEREYGRDSRRGSEVRPPADLYRSRGSSGRDYRRDY